MFDEVRASVSSTAAPGGGAGPRAGSPGRGAAPATGGSSPDRAGSQSGRQPGSRRRVTRFKCVARSNPACTTCVPSKRPSCSSNSATRSQSTARALTSGGHPARRRGMDRLPDVARQERGVAATAGRRDGRVRRARLERGCAACTIPCCDTAMPAAMTSNACASSPPSTSVLASAPSRVVFVDQMAVAHDQQRARVVPEGRRGGFLQRVASNPSGSGSARGRPPPSPPAISTPPASAAWPRAPMPGTCRRSERDEHQQPQRVSGGSRRARRPSCTERGRSGPQ